MKHNKICKIESVIFVFHFQLSGIEIGKGHLIETHL